MRRLNISDWLMISFVDGLRLILNWSFPLLNLMWIILIIWDRVLLILLLPDGIVVYRPLVGLQLFRGTEAFIFYRLVLRRILLGLDWMHMVIFLSIIDLCLNLLVYLWVSLLLHVWMPLRILLL